MPLFEIREEESWTAIIQEIYHSYQGVRLENIYQIEAENAEEAVDEYRRRGIHIEEVDEIYDDYYDSEYVDSNGEIDRQLDGYEVLEITNLSEEDREDEAVAPLAGTADHDWEV